jgi:indolepyruvate ferredoxin oxidoreductase beta subunit
VPSSASLSDVKYPSLDAILAEVARTTKNVLAIDARELAAEAGNPATQNVVMLGFISALGKLHIKSETLRETIIDRVALKYRDVNLKAYNLGFEEYQKKIQ